MYVISQDSEYDCALYPSCWDDLGFPFLPKTYCKCKLLQFFKMCNDNKLISIIDSQKQV